jgi:hypothetical protein
MNCGGLNIDSKLPKFKLNLGSKMQRNIDLVVINGALRYSEKSPISVKTQINKRSTPTARHSEIQYSFGTVLIIMHI